MREVGRDYDVIAERVKGKTSPEIKHYIQNFLRKVKLDPTTPDADLVEQLRVSSTWSEKEHRLFVESVREFGRDYEQIETKVMTKTIS